MIAEQDVLKMYFTKNKEKTRLDNPSQSREKKNAVKKKDAPKSMEEQILSAIEALGECTEQELKNYSTEFRKLDTPLLVFHLQNLSKKQLIWISVKGERKYCSINHFMNRQNEALAVIKNQIEAEKKHSADAFINCCPHCDSQNLIWLGQTFICEDCGFSVDKSDTIKTSKEQMKAPINLSANGSKITQDVSKDGVVYSCPHCYSRSLIRVGTDFCCEQCGSSILEEEVLKTSSASNAPQKSVNSYASATQASPYAVSAKKEGANAMSSNISTIVSNDNSSRVTSQGDSVDPVIKKIKDKIIEVLRGADRVERSLLNEKLKQCGISGLEINSALLQLEKEEIICYVLDKKTRHYFLIPVEESAEYDRKKRIYEEALTYQQTDSIKVMESVISKLKTIGEYKATLSMIDDFERKIDEKRKHNKYTAAVRKGENTTSFETLLEAASRLEELGEYKNALIKAKEFRVKAERMNPSMSGINSTQKEKSVSTKGEIVKCPVCHAIYTADMPGCPTCAGKATTNDTSTSSQSSTGGCYIATCVYGSYDCPQVWTLRRYRDNTLGTTWHGRLFIRTYYAISPTLVKWFGHQIWFKKLWRGKLDRMVNKLQSNGVEDTPYEDRHWQMK